MDASAPDRNGPFGARRWLGRLAAGALRALGATWRVEVTGPDPFARAAGPVLGAVLHRDFLVAAWLFRDRGIHVGVSRSRDGDLVDDTLACLGYAASARGSSSRSGASAQLALLDRLEGGASVAVVVDGPRGPAGQPKPGIAQLAAKTGLEISSLRVTCRFAWRFGSWDRAQLPLPFARVECRFGEPVAVAPGAEEAALSKLALRLR